MSVHTSIVERLLRVRRNGRLGHTLLLAGSGGCGAYEVAATLAKDVLGLPADAPGAVLFNHPDFTVVAPAPTTPERQRMGTADDDDPTTRTLTSDLFGKLEIGANWSITADRARQLIVWAAKTPWQASAKVALIAEADRVNEATADILLKTLEEPPEDVTLILVSARAQDLLPTVRSRAHEVRVPPLTDEELTTLLAERGCTDEEARAVVGLSGGNLWQARALVGGEANELRRTASALVGAAVDPERGIADVLTETRAALEGASSSSEVSELVRWIIGWLRDLLVALDDASAVRDDLREMLPSARKLGHMRLISWIEEADRVYEMLGRNVTPAAAVAALLIYPRDERRLNAAPTTPPLDIAVR